MADGIFHIRRKFRGRKAEFRIFKNRIIPEASFSPQLEYDPSRPSPFEGLIGAVGPEENENATECGVPFFWRDVFQMTDKLQDIFFVRCVRSGIPGGVYTGSSAQGIHLEARVVGKYGVPGDP